MTLVQVYYDPINGFDRLSDDALATQFCPRAYVPSSGTKHEAPRHRDVRPRLDLHASKDSNTITATFELPGLTSDNIAIDVHENRLTVSGEFAAPDSGDEKHYVVRERRAGKFSRTLQLPFGTKPDDVKAKMEYGVLTVTFPKTSPEQQGNRIPIQ